MRGTRSNRNLRLHRRHRCLLCVKSTSCELPVNDCNISPQVVCKEGKISSIRASELKEPTQTRTVVRGPIIIDARTLNAHPTILSNQPVDHHHHHHHHHQLQSAEASSNLPSATGWSTSVQWCNSCRNKSDVVGVAGIPSSLNQGSSAGPGTPVVGCCLLGVYPGSGCSTGPRAPSTAAGHLIQGVSPHLHQHHQPIASSVLPSTAGCRACCCHHQQQQPATAVQLTSQRGGISLRVARVASTTSVRAAPYAHSQHQGLGTECR